MHDYTAAAERVALGTGCAYADVFNNCQALVVHNKPEDLVGNNIHHPNDFWHWIFRALRQLGL